MPRFGEVRLRRTALTLVPSGARAGYTPPSADVLVLARCKGHGARGMQGTESGSSFFTGSVLESVACEPQPRPIGARDAGWPECSWVQVAFSYSSYSTMEFTGLTSASHMSLPEAGYGSEEGYVGSEISGAVSGVTTPGASRLQASQSQQRSTTMQRLHERRLQ